MKPTYKEISEEAESPCVHGHKDVCKMECLKCIEDMVMTAYNTGCVDGWRRVANNRKGYVIYPVGDNK